MSVWKAVDHRYAYMIAHRLGWCGVNQQGAMSSSAPNGTRFSCRRGARHRRASKKARSRAPKAVSCKRLLAGGAANFNLLDCAVFCPSEQLCNRQILVQFWPMQRTSTCTNFVCVALFRGCAMEEWKPDQWDTNDPSVRQGDVHQISIELNTFSESGCWNEGAGRTHGRFS